jgi:hypothetical protein
MTGLYALLTHAQPFWADVHALLSGAGGSTSVKSTVEPVDPETARAVCAILLAALFVGRTAKNFGLWQPFEKVQSMMKVERDRTGMFLEYTLLQTSYSQQTQYSR